MSMKKILKLETPFLDPKSQDPKTEETSYDRDEQDISFKTTLDRTFYLSVAAFLLSGASLAFSSFKTDESLINQLVMVDMTQLLRHKAFDMVNSKDRENSNLKLEVKIAENAQKIRSHIEIYAQKHQVTVIAKGAVFGSNIRDVTDDIESSL